MKQPIFINCSLAKKKVPLKPLEEHVVKLYACGVTVYDDCHIGHAMQALFFDMIRKFLRYVGYQVIYVRNYTDVDDKIIDRAAKLGMSPKALAEKIIESCQNDFARLGIEPADFEPKVSTSIPEIIEMIESLISQGFAYKTTDGDVYYRVREKADYGKLSNRSLDAMKSGSRNIIEGDKEELSDFALWKKDDTKDASWDSPWGKGRPGWHIECSAMAKKCLGPSIDIHGGGRDLIFPHHENEIAQSEAANQCAYASIWMHSGLLTINKQKMSKSLGNSISIAGFLQKWPSEVLRLSFLTNHYASPIDFGDEVFVRSLKRLLYYYQTLLELKQEIETSPNSQTLPSDLTELKQDFIKVMSEDFNTPEGFVILNKACKLAKQWLANPKRLEQQERGQGLLALILELASVFSLLGNDPESFIAELKKLGLSSMSLTEEEILALIKKRTEARAAKNWQLGDEIREKLLAQGIMINDRPNGTDWLFSFESRTES